MMWTWTRKEEDELAKKKKHSLTLWLICRTPSIPAWMHRNKKRGIPTEGAQEITGKPVSTGEELLNAQDLHLNDIITIYNHCMSASP